MRTEVIEADSVAEAAEQILGELKEDAATRSVSSRNNVIYFDGWDGLGASAVLRAVAQRLTAMASSDEAPAGLQFDQIIHVDCSKWESRRALQRAVAEQLELPAPVMDMFDMQAEEDDFQGIAVAARSEIPQVVRAMRQVQRVQKLNHRFLVIFHNGSEEDVDLATFCGFPLSGYSTNKVLWTFQGAFRLKPRMKVDDAVKSAGTTDVFLSASGHKKDPQELWNYLVHLDAADLARMITTTARASAETTSQTVVSAYYVANYFLYMWKLCGMVHHFRMDYDMATHGSNYWICDGAIQPEQGLQADIGNGSDDDDDGDGPWRAAAAVRQEMRLDSDYYHHSMQSLPSHLMRCADSTASMPYWTSPPHGVVFFSTGDTLQHFRKLGVLKLSRCTFSSSSPPFLGCRSLRFLWLDHCQDQAISKDGLAGKEEDIQHCLQGLWVLDVRYTRSDWILTAQMLDFMTQLRELNVIGAQDLDMGQLHGRLPNIRKLRVTKSTFRCSGQSEQDLFQGMNKMELLDFSGNSSVQGGVVSQLNGITSSSNQLETVVIMDGCVGIQKFSFRECAKMKNILLSGLFKDLRILDLSGTAVKTLDLSAMTARSLDELFLDGCHNLCSILWPPEDKRSGHINKLHIDTTTWSASAASSLVPMTMTGESTEAASFTTSLSVVHDGRAPSEFDWCFRVRDARLLRSCVPREQFYLSVYVEIYSPPSASCNNKAASSNSSSIKQQHALVKVDKPTDSFVYADVEVTFKDHPDQVLLQPSEGDVPMLTQMWPCPSIPSESLRTYCYTHIPDHQLSTKSLPKGEQIIIIPNRTIYDHAYVLHVHDSMSVTSIRGDPAPSFGGSTWYILKWCRVERCPKLEHVFTAPELQVTGEVRAFSYLETFWASQLPKAHYIWNWPPAYVFRFEDTSFESMRSLHMDLCPRVIHVLPLGVTRVRYGWTLYRLETLEIVWCGDLRAVFPLYTSCWDAKDEQGQSAATTTVRLPNLKRIHLHELPKMQGICGGRWRISASSLETVKIRGCWSLKRLPAVSSGRRTKVECDCEKEWWDMLEWDGVDAEHHPSMYKVTHSRYYKKTLLKGSLLR